MAYAVITGASSGMGRSFAFLLASKGYDLALIARRDKVLRQMGAALKKRYGTKTRIIKADLSDMGEVRRCIEALNNLDIEMFINNAGFGDAGSFKGTDLKKELLMIDLNVKAVHVFTKFMAEYFSVRGRGYLLNVASSAGLLPAGPFMATYYATKSYVASLTKAVAEEFKEAGSEVYVGCLCPGPVNTEFNDVANVRFSLPGISAKVCVSYAYRQMMRGKRVIVPTLLLKAAVIGQRFIPENMVIKMTASQQRKKL